MQNLAEKKTTFSHDIPFISMCFNINTSKCAILPKGKRLFCKKLHFFLSQENIHSLFSLLYFCSRVQGCVDCNAVRRARGKIVFFSEKESGRHHLEFFHEKNLTTELHFKRLKHARGSRAGPPPFLTINGISCKNVVFFFARICIY